jgi:putrescine aminotransferase
LQRRWRELAEHPLVGETRGKGLVAALEIVQDKQTNSRFPAALQAGMTCREFCFNNGLVMRAVGDTMIISPPLVITEEQVDELVNLARLSLDLTAAKLKG